MGSNATSPDSELERIQSDLEADFCPPLDPSLIAALVSELDPSPGSDALESLRLSLNDLATEASIAKALNEDNSISAFGQLAIEDDTPGSGSQTSASLLHEAGNSTPDTSTYSADHVPFDTPIGFLKTVFPHVPASTLREAIKVAHAAQDAATRSGGLDMALLIDSLLSEEFLREEQELALAIETSEESEKRPPEADWALIEKKAKRRSKSYDASPSLVVTPKPRKAKATTAPLVDLLQRHHAPPRRPAIDFDVAPDPWSHLSSLASSLGQLVPDMPEGKWLALFHNPAYPTPSHAVRAELQHVSLLPSEALPRETLTFLLEVIGVHDRAEDASRKKHDAELCLRACRNNAEDALDLYRLLEEMDRAGAAVIHSMPQPPTASSLRSVPQSPIPSAPPSPPPFNQAKRVSLPAQYQWQTVAPRKPAAIEQHPLAAQIPAYRIPEPPNGKKKGRPTPSFRKETEVKPAPPVPPGLNELEKARWWMKELKRQRDEAVRAAGRHWRAGTVQDRGGEIAMYYAQRGRALEDESREWAMKAARLQVRQQQNRNNDLYTIDLHGLTLQEALHVARDGVNAWYSSSSSGYAPGHSLTLVTGLGKHSVNQQSVLGPAVYNALEKDGWRVVKNPATIVVTGVARS